MAAIFLLTSFLFSVKIPARTPEVNKYFSLADEELLSGKYDKAIANYLKGMMFTTGKTEAEVFDDLGYAYLQKNELQKAKKYLIKSIGFHRENFNPRFYLAAVYILNNEIELAAEQLRIIEENVYFDQSWVAKTSNRTARKQNGKIIKTNELERIKKRRKDNKSIKKYFLI
jgi:tetratricopeptide (TPR) repeat protein